MRFLLATTALGAIAVAAPASAETVISTAVTAPQSTSASGDIRISSTGSVKPTSGVAVTVNTSNFAKNEGTIQITGANDSSGIVVNGGLTGEINNSGTITIDENFTATDSDNDGDLDGTFAQGSNRFGIHILGAHTGLVTNSGTITVEGNNSGGLILEGPLTGNLSNSGTITMLGDNVIGLKAGDVSGNVTFSKGAINAQGANAVGALLAGNIGGALVIQGTVQSTGYRYTTPPSDTSKLDADDLLQGGSALVIGGNVAGGILFDAAPKDNDTTDTDEDDDGIPDAQETTASINTFGSAPAVVIGSTTADTTIGAVAGSGGRGFVNKGSIQGIGLYKSVAANGLVIGGLGHSVNVTGGLTNTGTISARAGAEADATAVRIGAGASVPIIENGGTIAAQGGGTATTGARGIVIDAGATVTTIKNNGIIQATRAGTDGTAAAIIDNAGTVSLIENSGALGVTGATDLGDKAIAFDLRANGGGATVRQLAVTSGSAPQINGQMLFGAGNDTLDIADGSVTGAAKFGAGNNTLALSGDALMNGAVQFGAGNDTIQLAGTSRLFGNVDFGGGTDVLNLTGTSLYAGQLSNSANVAVNVGAGSSFSATNLGTVNLASLTMGAGSTLGVTLDSSGGVTLYNVAGAASIGTGSNIDINLVSLGGSVGTYKVLQAGTLTGGANLSTTSSSLPFLFDSSVVTSTPNEVSIVIRQKTAEELGINSSEASVLGAVIGAADADAPIAAYFLGIDDSETLQNALQQMLPDHAGGAFETATKGSRLTGRILGDPKAPLVRRGTLGFWAQQVAWGGSKAIGATSSYEVNGWGAAGGVETTVGALGNVGLMISYLGGKDGRKSSDNELTTGQYEGGVYWRGGYGPFRAFARATAGTVSFDGIRVFSANVDGSTVTREAKGKWNGRIYSGMAGVSYDMRFGRLSFRPSAGIEYYRLKERGYTEKGGGDAFDLTVGSRSSNETAATGTLAIGYELFGTSENQTFARIELEGGRRELLSGKLGATTARFGDGTPFTLTPEQRTSGFLGALRIIGGGSGLAITGELNAEQQQDKVSLGGRLGLQFNF